MDRRELMLLAAGMMATGRALRAQQKAVPVKPGQISGVAILSDKTTAWEQTLALLTSAD